MCQYYWFRSLLDVPKLLLGGSVVPKLLLGGSVVAVTDVTQPVQ